MARRERPAEQSRPVGVAPAISVLDSKIRLLAQRLKIVENNVQVMARTLISHNKKIKELEGMSGGGAPQVDVERIKNEIMKEIGGAKAGAPSQDFESLKERLDAIQDEIARLKSDVSEVKYIINTINPMELVTIEQVGEIVKEKMKEFKG